MIVEEMRDGTDPAIATWRLRAGDRELVTAALGGRLNHEVGDDLRRSCPGT